MGTVRDYSNRRPWTAEEEERLRELCEKYTKSEYRTKHSERLF